MPEKTHLIAIDPTADIAEVKDYLKKDGAFTHWWNHVPGVFMVTSRLTADDITDRLRPLTGDASFIVVGVRLDETQGWLPRRGWRWIQHRARELVSPRSNDAAHSADHS